MAGIDLVTLAALAQTIVLTVTAVILILQFRSQERAIKDSAYQRVLDDYNDTVRALVDHPELAALIDTFVRAGGEGGPARVLTPGERLVRSHLLVINGLLERVYLLYAKGWIDEETWKQWEAWLAAVAKNPLFGQIHIRSEGMFDPAFMAHVSRFVRPEPTRERPG